MSMFLWMVRHFRALSVIRIHLFAIVHLTGVLSGRNSVFALLIVILSQICIYMHVLYFIMDFEYIHYEVQNTDATQKLPIPLGSHHDGGYVVLKGLPASSHVICFRNLVKKRASA